MADRDLRAALRDFASRCNDNERLRQMNRDWTRTIAVRPSEDEPVFLRYEAGEVAVTDLADPDLVVEGPNEILCAIFTGETTPTEPYMDGTLLVRGSQDDMMRLDIISLLIWGE
ncbi:MAG: SCP2 sterol-binding domain-containing protein [Firmicutes bacterium]|jgi:putative sterol carrier protein|nr:SCP2 sterol-binding domain-containing protein [Bacillota bacterium]